MSTKNNPIDLVLTALRLQLAAVKQHFIHVLILEARRDMSAAAAITRIDSVDLPAAMYLVDHLVASGTAPKLSDDDAKLAQGMPRVGFRDVEIKASEQALEADLGLALTRAEESLDPSRSNELHGWAQRSLEPRIDHAAWLSSWMGSTQPTDLPLTALSDEQALGLDCLFASLMVVIEQGLIHSSVHWHRGERECAQFAWEVSGAAMMQATAMTKLLARHHLAPNPARSLEQMCHVILPEIADDSNQAIEADRALANRCGGLVRQCDSLLSGTRFESVLQEMATYCKAVASWKSGGTLPQISNPCRDLDRTRKLYVTPDRAAKSA